MKEFNTTISSLNDSRLKNISWDIHHNPTIPGVLGFISEAEIIPIPSDSVILGTLRPVSHTKRINLPIAISGYSFAENIKNECRMGYIKYQLDVTSREPTEPITLLQFFKAIYDFYETQITEDQYISLLNETKVNRRKMIYESFKTDITNKPKKALREYFAGSMYFEGYDHYDRLMLYGT